MSIRRPISVLACVAFLATAMVVVSCLAEESEPLFGNVQILKDVKSKKEMRGIMKAQAKALGVKCTYCHVKGKFDLDDKEHKKVARDMMTMVDEINERYFPEAEQGITCWTCHQGHEEPQLTRPVEVPAPAAGFEAAGEPKK